MTIASATPLSKVVVDPTYAERYVRISSGRLPRFFVERLISFRGLDSAMVSPRYPPTHFQKDGVRRGGAGGSEAAPAKVERWDTRCSKSS